MLFKLAWRNIWRNKTRTAITMAAVFLAVILSTMMMSVKEGVYKIMIESMVGAYTGYGQVHSNGYWDEQTIDNVLQFSDTLKEQILNEPGISGYAPRIEGFALAASDNQTKGAMIVGVDPELEIQYTAMNERVTEGEYLEKGDKGVLIGNGLAEYLKLGVGDTIVAIGQGYHGATAAGKYSVKGIIRFGSPELSKQLIVLPMNQAQLFFGVEDQLSTIVLLFDDNDKAIEVSAGLKQHLSGSYEVMNWKELIPDVISMIEADRVEGYIFMFILYMVISFGIFGTVLMMLSERMHEFGVLVAVGMKRTKLSVIVWIEVMIISILGAFFGMFGAFPICYFMYANPIDMSSGEMGEMYEDYGMEPILQASIDPSVFITQGTIVAIIASIIALYPLFSVMRINAIKAMRS